MGMGWRKEASWEVCQGSAPWASTGDPEEDELTWGFRLDGGNKWKQMAVWKRA